MAVGVLIVVASGFAPRLYQRPADLPPVTPRVAAHAALFSAWVGLFIAQTVLIASGHSRAHRRLGVATLGVAAAMVASSPPLAIGLARRGVPPGDPLAFLMVIVPDVLLFGAFVGTAMYYRRRREAHKRLMLLATIVLLPASVSRWPIAAQNPAPAVSGVLAAFIVAMFVNDLVVRRRPHPASVWGGLLILVSLPVRFAISQTAAWHHIAAWLIR
jgi:hypothetical protein